MASASEVATHPSPSDDAAAAAAPTPGVTDDAAPVADAEEKTEGVEETAAEGSAAAEAAAAEGAEDEEGSSQQQEQQQQQQQEQQQQQQQEQEQQQQGPPRLHAFQQSVLDMKDPEAQTKCVQLQRVSLAAMYTTSEELQEFNRVSETELPVMKHNFDKYCGMMTGLAKDLSTIDIMLQNIRHRLVGLGAREAEERKE